MNLSSILIRWYNATKRDLPWRETKSPYLIWISEIILQQTRVAQGYSYYIQFVREFPTVEDLARASERDVLNLWQGLGYYSRARNLHYAAKTIVDLHASVFPRDYKEIRSLKGVGDYTAAAIASFAYNLPYATVDGNVYRVLSRVFALDDYIDTVQGKKVFAKLADEVMDKSSPGAHNQAVMEFGALQCVPVSPDCTVCPLGGMCMSLSTGSVGNYPKKKGRVKVRSRYFNYLDVRCDDVLFLKERGVGDIWQGLYDFPLVETGEKVGLGELLLLSDFTELFPNELLILSIEPKMEVKHVLSHQIVYAVFYKIKLSSLEGFNFSRFTQVGLENIDEYPISRLIDKYLSHTIE